MPTLMHPGRAGRPGHAQGQGVARFGAGIRADSTLYTADATVWLWFLGLTGDGAALTVDVGAVGAATADNTYPTVDTSPVEADRTMYHPSRLPITADLAGMTADYAR